jgi:D-glycero-alpha-D-manno-heptose-7-phosphate kinase
MVSKHELAMEGIHIEQDVLKETVGSQDQVLAAYGGFNRIRFAQSGEITVSPMTISRGRVNDLTDHLMLFYTGIKRTASDVADTYVPDILDKNHQMRRMRTLVDDACGVLTSDESLESFGELLHESWLLKQSLSLAVSSQPIDDLYSAARQAGAIGGKVTGAGGGGFMLLFVPIEKKEQVRRRLSGLIHVPIRIESAGSQIIFFDRQEDYSAEAAARASGAALPFREWNAPVPCPPSRREGSAIHGGPLPPATGGVPEGSV